MVPKQRRRKRRTTKVVVRSTRIQTWRGREGREGSGGRGGGEGLEKHVEEVAGHRMRGLLVNGEIEEGGNAGARGWDGVM